MKNRVVYRNRDGSEWAEILLVGRKPLAAKVDMSDVSALGRYRWGWHPRGVFDHRAGVLLTHVLMPDARVVFFQNQNRLDCRRDNLLTGILPLRKRRILGRGVYYDDVRAAYVAYHKRLGVTVYGYFRISNFCSAAEAEGAALRLRAKYVEMSDSEILAEKARRSGPVSDEERWLGEDIVGHIVARVDRDPVEAARKGYEAGLFASRVIGSAEIGRWQEFGGTGKRNGREMVAR